MFNGCHVSFFVHKCVLKNRLEILKTELLNLRRMCITFMYTEDLSDLLTACMHDDPLQSLSSQLYCQHMLHDHSIELQTLDPCQGVCNEIDK